MPILQNDESLKNNNPSKDKHLHSGNNNPPNDKLLPKRENTDEILVFPKEKQKNIVLNPLSHILPDIERKYLTFPKFIYNNPNGLSYCETSTESVRPEKFQFLQKGPNRNLDYKVVNFG